MSKEIICQKRPSLLVVLLHHTQQSTHTHTQAPPQHTHTRPTLFCLITFLGERYPQYIVVVIHTHTHTHTHTHIHIYIHIYIYEERESGKATIWKTKIIWKKIGAGGRQVCQGDGRVLSVIPPRGISFDHWRRSLTAAAAGEAKPRVLLFCFPPVPQASFRRWPSMCQKRPSMCQKRPSVCQKRPSMSQET